MKKIYFTWNGLGDNLALIGAASNYFNIFGEKLTIGVPSLFYKEIFDCANFVDWCNFDLLNNDTQGNILKYIKSKEYEPIFLNACGFRYIVPDKKNITIWYDKPLMLRLCERIGMNGSIDICYPTSLLMSKSGILPRVKEYVCIMTGGIQNYKAVNADVMQKLVNYYKNTFCFVQIGSSRDLLLKDVIDKRGLKITDAYILLRDAKFIICGTGGLVHLSAAAKCKALVIQTGGEPLGPCRYVCHRYVRAVDYCGLCAKNYRDPQHQPCFYNYKCIRNITADLLIKELEKNLPYLCSNDNFIYETLNATPEPAQGIQDLIIQKNTLDNPLQYFKN